MKGISVIICCYNSSLRITDTLSYLKNQVITNNVAWELVLVDNNSTDNTVDIVKKYWNCNISLNIVHEAVAGLSNARKAGANAAKYEYFIFCDDDNWLSSGFLNSVFTIFETNPTVGAIGGRSEATFGNGVIPPSWFTTQQSSFAVGNQNESSGIIQKKYLWGASLAIKKLLFEVATDSQHPLLLSGRKGKVLTAGEDTELCMRLILMNYQLYYDDSLHFFHFIPAERLTTEYLDKLKKGFAESHKILGLYAELIKFESNHLSAIAGIFSSAINDIKKTDIKFSELRKFLFWRWGIQFFKNPEMKAIRNFYSSINYAACKQD